MCNGAKKKKLVLFLPPPLTLLDGGRSTHGGVGRIVAVVTTSVIAARHLAQPAEFAHPLRKSVCWELRRVPRCVLRCVLRGASCFGLWCVLFRVLRCVSFCVVFFVLCCVPGLVFVLSFVC